MTPSLAFVDLETTGGLATRDRITEIGIIEVDAEGVREWSSLVNPGVSIPPYIEALTGITEDMVRDAPGIPELVRTTRKRSIRGARSDRSDQGGLRHSRLQATENRRGCLSALTGSVLTSGAETSSPRYQGVPSERRHAGRRHRRGNAGSGADAGAERTVRRKDRR